MSKGTAHCQWKDEMVRERTGHSPSNAVAKKIKWPTLHTHGCLRVNARLCDCLFHLFLYYSAHCFDAIISYYAMLTRPRLCKVLSFLVLCHTLQSPLLLFIPIVSHHAYIFHINQCYCSL